DHSFSAGGSEAFFGGALDSPSQLPETLCNPSGRVLSLIDAFTYELVSHQRYRSCRRVSSRRGLCCNLHDVIDDVISNRDPGRGHEAVELGCVVELVDEQPIWMLEQVNRKKTAADCGRCLAADELDLWGDLHL